jgi:hypothetical protein
MAQVIEIPWGRLGAGTAVVGADSSIRTIDRVERHGCECIMTMFVEGHRETHHVDSLARVVVDECSAIESWGRSEPGSIDVDRFARTNRADELEALADRMALDRDVRAIPPLIARLGDGLVQDHADVEDAVCTALVRLGVMRSRGNLSFAFVAVDSLGPEARAALRDYATSIPRRYFRDDKPDGRR